MWLLQISEPRSILVLQHKATNQHGFKIDIVRNTSILRFGQHHWTKRICYFFLLLGLQFHVMSGHMAITTGVVVSQFVGILSPCAPPHISTPTAHPKRHRNIVDFDWIHLWFGYIPMQVECPGFFDKSRVLLVKPAFCWWNADLLVWPV